MNLSRFLWITINLVLVTAVVNKITAQPPAKKTGDQFKLLLKEKKSRTAIQQKIDSRLLQAIRENRREKIIKGINMETANVGADKAGNLTVDIEAQVSDSLIDHIKSLGGTIISSFKQYNAIRAMINLSKIECIAALKEVKFVTPAAVPQINRVTKPVEGTDVPLNNKPD